MNKRGFLLASETLKIVVAVICIMFLIYFLVSLYFSKTGAEKIKEAEDSLGRINDIILALPEGGSGRQDIPNPKSWNLFNFIGEYKPNSCAGKNCLCICKNVFEYGIKEKELRQASKCDSKGSCLIVSDLTGQPLDIKIKGPDDLVFILIKKQNGEILITEDES